MYGYYEQNGSSLSSLIDYVSQMLAYHRSDTRFYKNIILDDMKEQRKLKRISKNSRSTKEIIGTGTYEDGTGTLAKRALLNPPTNIPRF